VINFILRWIYLLSRALRAVIRQDTKHAASALLFMVITGRALKMLSQDDALGIIAKLITKKIDATYVCSVIPDADPHRDGLARFEPKIFQLHVRDGNPIHVAAVSLSLSIL
jgi:hypothetical protein